MGSKLLVPGNTTIEDLSIRWREESRYGAGGIKRIGNPNRSSQKQTGERFETEVARQPPWVAELPAALQDERITSAGPSE